MKKVLFAAFLASIVFAGCKKAEMAPEATAPSAAPVTTDTTTVTSPSTAPATPAAPATK
jgi:PBP1b-binding outer membrane lipoprotein LpoB